MEKVMKKFSLSILFVGLILGLLMTGFVSLNPSFELQTAEAAPKQIKLKFATHVPSIHHGVRNFLEPLAKEVEKRTEGRVKIVIYPDQQLGKLPEMYDRLVDGTCDMAWILPIFVPGRCPLEGVFSLPTLVEGDSLDPTSTAIRTMIYEKYLNPMYFSDVKVLWTGRFGLINFHTAKKPLKKLEDLEGIVIGFPGGNISPRIIKALGASPEMFKSPDVYTSLERGIFDCIMWPLDGLEGYKLFEVVKYTTLINFGSASNFTAINKNSWNKLSPADQKVITDLSPWAQEIQGKTTRNEAERAIARGKESGLTFIKLSETERQRWVKAVEPVTKQWIAEMDAEGMPASEMYQDILKILNQ